MPLFGFRKDKKHEQSHIQAEAGLAKSSSVAGKKGGARKGPKQFSSAKPEKIAQAVMTKDAGAAKSAAVQSPVLPSGAFSIAAGAIIRPRVTEKSGILSQSGMYTFQSDEGRQQAVHRQGSESSLQSHSGKGSRAQFTGQESLPPREEWPCPRFSQGGRHA